ncbi:MULTISPECIES: hypothetical protein [Pseudobacillus]|uniref:hypothetical protein n=1 Tax=Pseudobacillus TaxID=108525 RepID=UPI0038793910
MIKLRLPLASKSYSYITASAHFSNGKVEVHLADRPSPRSSVSIIDAIEEVQEQILDHLKIQERVLYFLRDSIWVLYGIDGNVYKYHFGDLVELSPNHPLVKDEMLDVMNAAREKLISKTTHLHQQMVLSLF